MTSCVELKVLDGLLNTDGTKMRVRFVDFVMPIVVAIGSFYVIAVHPEFVIVGVIGLFASAIGCFKVMFMLIGNKNKTQETGDFE